ncbi:DUF3071 domain-containing protein [Kribbella capetownensis]|uniref:DUF3071 domain-containing protein n=1 Tax=Kribbella capetownensis TaxID=1572659 RepID=A0A4R0JZ17_9ACTN|nr:septation protein SepH [Kribbella capetownensis]TCC47655.1 DUF3071 domain-containing protein [Kribbella capetownensis]
MREARLVGLSQDGKQLILALAETGEEFAVPVDDRLRAALRGDRARLGQLEIQMESALRPRDIQARIRAGESPEAVAAVAQMPMERVMAFAGPVLAERDHIASLAQRASVRRRGGADAPTRNLGAWVTERLRTRQVDPASAEWDAWRRDDGRWAVRVSYFVAAEDAEEQKEEKIAMFAYDAPGRYAVPDDDEARWLVGEQAQVMLPPPVQPAHQPGERRLSAVADIDLSIAPDHGADSYEAGFEDTVSLPRRNQPVSREASHDSHATRDAERGPRRVHSVPDPDEEPTLIDVPVEQPPTLRPAVRAVERPTQLPAEAASMAPPEERAAARENPFTERRATPDRTPPAPVRQAPESRPAERPAGRTAPVERSAPEPTEPTPPPVEETAPMQPATTEPPAAPAASAAAADVEPAAKEEAPAEPKKKPARRNAKRASVPSWDEIMFGKKAD